MRSSYRCGHDPNPASPSSPAPTRAWFGDHGQAPSRAEAAQPVLDLVLAEHVDPALYGELIRFGRARDWYGGTPQVEQDRMLKS
ncbi:hypothetical protein [Streptomyces sp. NPDC056190]|uniref:hypothetical protein n=1 Tax=unclassified Streptomyces TaxID=2593676 RepID=UPI0035D93FF1